ncbi:MAG TPA: sugar phosphate isomerase/epimerase family protein [Actinomycetes bacterium]|nr:sugar phosphate isomerase/epimerase family protein [Actinomycetes bacterium]
MKLSCQEQLLPGGGLEAKWEFATGAGFEGIELRARGDGHFAARLPELRAAAKAGVVMATVCPETDHFIGDFDPGRRRDAVEQLRAQLSVIAELGGDGVLTPASWGMFSLRLPPFTPPRGQREDRRVLLEALVELAPHAAAEGVWLAVEPINRYEDYMVNRIDQAVSLGEEVERQTGLGSVRVCADLFHMNIEEDDLAAAIRAAGPRIAHVHVDDTNRLQPGTGHMDFAAVFAALGDVGYDDWLTFECRLRGEPEEALPASARFLRQFL